MSIGHDSRATLVIERLCARQRADRLNDTELASRLKISVDTWRKVKTGERALSVRILTGILAAYPEFDEEVVLFLRVAGTRRPGDGTEEHDQALALVPPT